MKLSISELLEYKTGIDNKLIGKVKTCLFDTVLLLSHFPLEKDIVHRIGLYFDRILFLKSDLTGVLAVLILLVLQLNTIGLVHIQKGLFDFGKYFSISTLHISSFLSSTSSTCDLLNFVFLKLLRLSIA